MLLDCLFFPLSQHGQRSIITASCKQRINVFMCLESRQTIHDKDSLLLVQRLIFLLLVTVNSDTWKVNLRNTGVGTSSSDILFL